MTVQYESIIPLRMARLKFGNGATEELGYELKTIGAKKALLVADRRLWDLGLVDRVKGIVEAEGIALTIYDAIHVEPTDVSFRHAIAFALENPVDAFVALGGGSTLDTAKAMNLFSSHPADLYDYINKPIGKGKPVPGPLKPLVAMPTTSGTGSETTAVILLDLLEMHLKTGISHQHIRPAMAIVDPLNTVSMPAAVTAATGLDVFTHASESFTINLPPPTQAGEPGAAAGLHRIQSHLGHLERKGRGVGGPVPAPGVV